MLDTIQEILGADAVLATVMLRRSAEDGYSVHVHRWAENARPDQPELGVVAGGVHAIGRGATLTDAIVDVVRILAGP